MTEEERVLRKNLEDALFVLAPKFKIDDLEIFPEPGVLVYDGRTQYNITQNRFEFNRERVSIPVVIGEEVSHYLHLQLNPIHLPTNLTNSFEVIRLVTLMETVGRYGGLVYLKENGMEIKSVEEKRPRFSYPVYDDQFDFTDDFSHNYGYKLAHRLMELHGDSMLPILSRMSVDEALKALPRIAPITWIDRNILPIIDSLTRYKPKLKFT